MSDMATAVATVLALVCDIPHVVDVAAGNRFGSDIVHIVVRGHEDRAEVDALVDDDLGGEVYSYVTAISGGLKITRDHFLTKLALHSSSWPRAMDYGSVMNRVNDRLMKAAFRREEAAWDDLNEDAKNLAVADHVAWHRNHGLINYGNCWTGPVSDLSDTTKTLIAGLDDVSAEVLAAARDMPGVIDVTTSFRSTGYFSDVTVTPSADEDAVTKRLTDINGGTVWISRFFYPNLHAAVIEQIELDNQTPAPRNHAEMVALAEADEARGDPLDRASLRRQDAAVWAQMGELRQNEAIEAEIARHHDAGDTSFGNSW
jgi:hypothetical protein